MIEELKDTVVGLCVLAIGIVIISAIGYAITQIFGPLGLMGIFYSLCILFVSWVIGGEIRKRWIKK